MVDLSCLAGNEAVKTVLSGPVSLRSVLLEGPAGSGRHALAERLAAAALCTGKEMRPCGRCDACRKFAAGDHVDVHRLSGELKLDELRDALDGLDEFPGEGVGKVYIIDNADKLGLLQQNRLLKTLEEPPAFCTFILIALSGESLLETVRSRCLCLTLRPAGQTGSAAEESLALARQIAEGDLVGLCTALSAQKDREQFRKSITELKTIFTEAATQSALGNAYGDKTVASLGTETLCRLSELFFTLEEKTSLNVNLSLWSTAVARACYGVLQRRTSC